MNRSAERLDPLRERYPLYLRRALVTTLLLMIAFFVAFKRFEVERPAELPSVSLNVVVEPVPATRQGSRRPPPQKPAVPVEAETESLPEDEPIDWSWQEGTGQETSGNQPEGTGGALLYLPRTIRDVIPEYPEKLKGKVRGTVKLMLQIDPSGRVVKVLVVENTTGNEVLEEAAVRAAERCLFAPPRDAHGRPVSVWVTKIYRFE